LLSGREMIVNRSCRGVHRMELPVIFITAFIVGLSGAMMPGPLSAVVLERTLREGFRAGPLAILGHAVPEALAVALLAAGLGGCLTHPLPAGIIGIIGGAVLSWMGYGMLRDARAGSLSLDSPGAGGTGNLPGGSFGAGIAASLSNPYWFIWWTTVGAGYVVLSSREHGFAGALLFFSGHILSDLAWFSLLALAVTSGRRLITPSLYRGIMALLGVFLIVFALYFAWSGIKLLVG
jgi:threonine/homoserine/homoserine lactone efflux protein